MPQNLRRRVASLELPQQGFQRRKLRRREVVFRFVVGIYAAGQANADGVAVVAPHVGTDGVFRTPGFQLAVAADHVVIAHGVEAALDVPLGDVAHADVGIGAGRGAVDDDEVGAVAFLENG